MVGRRVVDILGPLLSYYPCWGPEKYTRLFLPPLLPNNLTTFLILELTSCLLRFIELRNIETGRDFIVHLLQLIPVCVLYNTRPQRGSIRKSGYSSTCLGS